MDAITKFFSSKSPKKHKRPSVTKKSPSTNMKQSISPLMLLSMQMPTMNMTPSVRQRTGRYHSEQTHIEFVNGVKQERRQIVDVNGSKGTKTVIITRNDKTKKSTKPLSAKEIGCIRKCKFMPGLFNECDKCIR
jgi:hypothetical protein